MATQIVMPQMSDTMKEGTVVAWKKAEGDPVEAGELLAEIQSDKATLELEAYASGVLRKIVVAEDETVPVGSLIAVIAEEDEDISAVLKGEGGGVAPAEKKSPAAPQEPAPEAEAGEPEAEEKPKKQPKKPAPVAKPVVEKRTAPPAPAKPEPKAEEKPAAPEPARKPEVGHEGGAFVLPREATQDVRVKFGGRGAEMGLSEAAAQKVISQTLSTLEARRKRREQSSGN